jgi:competence protein ComEA
MKTLAALILVLNLNTATPKQLEALPGVGPVLAKRIVEFREKKGGYKRIEELLAIPGISEKKWRALREFLVLQ